MAFVFFCLFFFYKLEILVELHLQIKNLTRVDLQQSGLNQGLQNLNRSKKNLIIAQTYDEMTRFVIYMLSGITFSLRLQLTGVFLQCGLDHTVVCCYESVKLMIMITF